MGRVKLLALPGMMVGIALLMGGCGAGYQARSVELKESLLINPAILEKGTGDQMLYRYEKPNVDVKKYTEIIIDPVIVSKAAELDAGDLENYQKLANNAFVYLTQELQKDYKVVQTPGPNTLRMQMAIIDADTSKPVRNFTSSVMPMGIGLNLVKYAATGKQSGVGEITVELKLTDAGSGELLGAAVDRRVGGKGMKGIWERWYHADEALKFWSMKARYVLCERRGATNCEKPESKLY